MSRATMSAVAVFSSVFALSPWARATPHSLPFSYNYATLGEGELEVEQYVDYTPVRVPQAASAKTHWFGATQFQTEFEYGLSDRLELGLYVTYVPLPNPGFTSAPTTMMEGNGIKQRLHLRLAEEGEWPIDTGLYGEITETDREIELEGKILLEKHIGPLRLISNLWAEYEFYFDGTRDLELNPTLGASYEVTPMFQPGIESWMSVEFPDPAPNPRPFNVGPHVYVGPTTLLQFGKLWWCTGVYARVTDTNHRLDARPGQTPDAFGNLWARTIIGLNL